MKTTAFEAYEEALRPHREKFRDSPAIRDLLRWRMDSELLELFVLYWSTFSSGFVEPVAGYIREAGERSRELGFHDVVPFFVEHAEEEEGHDKWAADDAHRLVALWNKRRRPSLDAEELLAQRMSPAVRRYHKLHESVIRGEAPYAELAIDVEIELITVQYGPRMILHILLKLGPRITWGMSFLREHVRFDFGHTKFNMKTLDALLSKHPDYAPALVRAGQDAVDAYLGFIEECYSLAKEKQRSLRGAPAPAPRAPAARDGVR